MAIGFIGLGAVVDTAYLPALQRMGFPLTECYGYDPDPARCPAGIVRCDSLEQLLASAPETVFITTSSLWHIPVLEQVLRSDVPRIVVEKPVAATLAQIAQLKGWLNAPETAARVLALDHWMARDGVQQLASGTLESHWQPDGHAQSLPPLLTCREDIVRIEGFLQEPSGFNAAGEPMALNFATGEPDTRQLRHPDGVIIDIGTHVLAMLRETLAVLGAGDQLTLHAVRAVDRLGRDIALGDTVTAEGEAHLQGDIDGIPLVMWLNKYAGPAGGQKGIRLHLRDGSVLSQDRRGTQDVLELIRGESVLRWTLAGPVYDHCLRRYILGDNSLFVRAPARVPQMTQRRIAEVERLLDIQQTLRGPH